MIPATVMVIAKEPVPGRVKTRLCPPCEPREAAAIARAALTDTLATVAAVPVRRRVIVLDGEPGPWLPADFDVVEQVAGALDRRLTAAFDAVDGPAFLVGMDTPQLDVATLTSVLRTLLRPGIDAVLGPAVDGGWWGIGLRHGDPRVFHGVPMSTSQTIAHQLRRLQSLALRTRIVGQLRDVDDFDDALAVAAMTPGSTFAHAVDQVRRSRVLVLSS